MFKKSMIAALAVAVGAMLATPAEAQYRVGWGNGYHGYHGPVYYRGGYGHGYYGGGCWGCGAWIPFAVGVGAGTIIATQPAPVYIAPQPVYVAPPQPVYVAPPTCRQIQTGWSMTGQPTYSVTCQ